MVALCGTRAVVSVAGEGVVSKEMLLFSLLGWVGRGAKTGAVLH